MTKRKKLSAILLGAILALGVGAGIGAGRVEAGKAAEVLINSFDFMDGGDSTNSGYANTNLATNVSYASDNPGGTSGTTAWEADWANLSLNNGTRLGGKLESTVQTDDTTPWANIKTTFTFDSAITKVEILGVDTFGTAGNVGGNYLQNSTNGTTWTTIGTSSTKSGTITHSGLTIPAGSYLRFGTAITAPAKNSGLIFTGIKIYSDGGGETPSKTLTFVEVTQGPSKTTYNDGDPFDPTGVIVEAEFDDGDSYENVTASVVYEPSTMSVGVTEVKASYTYGGTTMFDWITGITVNAVSYSKVTYDLSAKDTLTTSGTAPSGSSATIKETYGTTKQMTSGNSQTVTLTGYNAVKLSEITISMKSNKSSGSGTLEYSLDNGTTYNTIIATAAFNTESWYGAWSTNYVDVTKTIDISVATSIIFKISATDNSLYAQSYSLKWEQLQAETLTGLTMNKSQVDIIMDEVEQLAVIPTPALASYDVEWDSSNENVATVDQNGLVYAVSVGSATITATDKNNTSIYAESVVTVLPMPDYDFFKKITNESQLHLGSTYVIANSDGSIAMKNEAGANNIPGQVTRQKDGDIRDQDVLMKFTLEAGSVDETYAFKSISTHEDSNGKYMYAAGGTADNWLRLKADPDGNASWLISFEEAGVSMIAQGASTRNYFRFNENNGNPIFSAYGSTTSVKTLPSLFLLDDGADPDVAAVEGFVTNFMHPEIETTNVGTGECISEGYYADAKAAFNTLTAEQRELFVSDDAFEAPRARLVAWAIANGDILNTSTNLLETPVNPSQNTFFNGLNDSNTIMLIVIISLISVSVLAGAFYLRKKEQN